MELVEGALSMPAPVREAWLAAQCPEDPGLMAEILDRVTWEEKMGDFLREPIVARALSRAETFAPGSTLAGRYRLTREIGRGRWSVVLEALDTSRQRRVAIRVGSGARQVANPPVHEGIVQQYEYDEIDTLESRAGFAVLEYLEGPTLAERLRREDPVPAEEARAVALLLCRALFQAGQSGFRPASLNAHDLILSGRGPVLICDWLVTNRKPNDAAELTSIGLILRRLFSRVERDFGTVPGDSIVRRCLGQAPEPRYPSLGALERDLLPSAGVVAGLRRRLGSR